MAEIPVEVGLNDSLPVEYKLWDAVDSWDTEGALRTQHGYAMSHAGILHVTNFGTNYDGSLRQEGLDVTRRMLADQHFRVVERISDVPGISQAERVGFHYGLLKATEVQIGKQENLRAYKKHAVETAAKYACRLAAIERILSPGSTITVFDYAKQHAQAGVIDPNSMPQYDLENGTTSLITAPFTGHFAHRNRQNKTRIERINEIVVPTKVLIEGTRFFDAQDALVDPKVLRAGWKETGGAIEQQRRTILVGKMPEDDRSQGLRGQTDTPHIEDMLRVSFDLVSAVSAAVAKHT